MKTAIPAILSLGRFVALTIAILIYACKPFNASGLTLPQSCSCPLGSVAQFFFDDPMPVPVGTQFSYQWYKDGVALSESSKFRGTWSSTLQVRGVTHTDAGGYVLQVIESSIFGYQFTNSTPAATLTVQDPFVISQPASQTLWAGQTAVFSVSVTATAPLTYQWIKNSASLTNGGNVSGAAIAALTLNNLQPGDAGSYSVIVSNSYGQITSQIAALSVALPPPPRITINDGAFGFRSSQFCFNINGTNNQPVIIEGSTDLQNWSSVGTETIGASSSYFQDADATNYDRRFYRVRTP